MVEIFSGTAHLEILTELEAHDNDTSNLTEEDTRRMLNAYPLFDYLFNTQDIPELEEDKYGLHLGAQYLSRQKNKFTIPTANPISVEERITRKDPDKYEPLKNTLKSMGLRLESVIDVEYFESYKNQKDLIQALTEDQRRTGTTMQELRKHIRRLQESEFEHTFDFVSQGEYGLERITEVLKGERPDKRAFTALLDTEKIHLQFAEAGGKTIIVYFGYGNHDAFTRNLPGKNRNEGRMERIDLMSAPTADMLRPQFAKSDKRHELDLLQHINACQLGYEEYFENLFSYESRLEEFKGEHDSRQVDKILMLPARMRTKSAALIAYNQLVSRIKL